MTALATTINKHTDSDPSFYTTVIHVATILASLGIVLVVLGLNISNFDSRLRTVKLIQLNNY